MEHTHDHDNNHNSKLDRLKHDLDPGMENRNLLSDQRQEAPIDKDLPTGANMSTDAGDETYEDDSMGDRDYYEERAPDNVRK